MAATVLGLCLPLPHLIGLALAAAPAGQEVPEPPPRGDVVFQSALTDPDVFEAGTCPSGRAGGQYVDEGFALIVEGRCVASQQAANLAVTGRGISIGDGELALDFRAPVGAERAGLNLYARNREGRLIAAYLDLGTGQAELFWREGGVNTIVASRGDLGEHLDPNDWNRVALRVRGGEVWLLLNEAPLLHAEGLLTQVGGVAIGAVRAGNLEDEDQVVLVFRDLTLSTIEGGDPERAPSYTAP